MRLERQMQMEQHVMRVIDDKRKELGMSIEELGRLVYPKLTPGAARMRIQNMRKPMATTKKLKRLTYTDFVLLSSAVRMSPSEVITLVSQYYPDIHDEDAEPKAAEAEVMAPIGIVDKQPEVEAAVA